MAESKRILSIHAHPDDAEMFAGGTLALLAGRGHDSGRLRFRRIASG